MFADFFVKAYNLLPEWMQILVASIAMLAAFELIHITTGLGGM